MEKDSENGQRRNSVSFAFFGICLVAVAVVLIIIFLLNGNVSINNDNGGKTTVSSLTCESSKIFYPFFSFDNSVKKSLKINIIFSNDKVDEISLIYKLYYNNETNIINSEAMNHADLNKSFSSNGLSADSFDAVYAKLGDAMQLSMHADSHIINDVAGKFFLLDKAASSYTRESLSKHYNTKGLNCTVYD